MGRGGAQRHTVFHDTLSHLASAPIKHFASLLTNMTTEARVIPLVLVFMHGGRAGGRVLRIELDAGLSQGPGAWCGVRAGG